MKPARLGLHDLRPNATIRCLYCDQTKPQAGAIKFHALHVCADCAQKLRKLNAKAEHEA